MHPLDDHRPFGESRSSGVCIARCVSVEEATQAAAQGIRRKATTKNELLRDFVERQAVANEILKNNHLV